MPDEKESTSISISTKEIPVVYANHASISMSFHDMRIFFAEALPQTVEVADIASATLKKREALYRPVVSLVLTPEFARNLMKSLTDSINKYEQAFGPLRPEPTAETIKKMFEPK